MFKECGECGKEASQCNGHDNETGMPLPPPTPRTVIAMSMGYWGSHPYSGVGVGPSIVGAIKYAMKRLRKSGGSTAKGKMLLISAPPGAWIDSYGTTCWNDPDNVHDRPYYIDRDGNRLAEQAKPMV